MAAKKNLGMGLDLLLSAAETKKQLESIEEAQRLFAMAIDFDEEGNCLEAYYYYRKMIDDFSHLENQAK
ncbi:hypothetical protein [Syntrophomonas palmitatica]|uniref:hypothetical protein n=1 Tax=Syntrophomonas palmitatica TaxID=402877 RepID=UPI0006D13BAF|nr:hypothetical protein [Syntrophomonas palmitatica]